jgi:predicted metal-dependent hydrolase
LGFVHAVGRRDPHLFAPSPGYVLDYVIVHELAHLVEHGHGPKFKDLEDRFPQRERAEGFLEAMSLGLAAPEFQAE